MHLAFAFYGGGFRRYKRWQSPCPVSRPNISIVVARSARLLVVELGELERESDASANKEFHERVDVDRKQSQTTYVVYTSPLGYDQAMNQISNNQFVSPDALIAVNGSEIYQQYCRVPDPYWEQTVRTGWDPKPIKWTISSFFKEELQERGEDYDQDFEIHYEIRACDIDRTLFLKDVQDKLSEMGLSCRVRAAAVDSPYLTVIPAAGSTLESVEFCQKMLHIGHDSTYVYGSGPFLKSFVEGVQNWGISHVSFQQDLKEDVESGRVFLSNKVGTAGLLDGIIHFAVF